MTHEKPHSPSHMPTGQPSVWAAGELLPARTHLRATYDPAAACPKA